MTRPPTVRPAGRSRGWDPTDLALAALAATLAGAFLLWTGAALATVLVGHPIPQFDLLAPLLAVLRPGDPAAAWPHPASIPGPLEYWTCTLLVLAGAGIGAYLLARPITGWLADRAAPSHQRLRSLPGLATRRELRQAAAPATVLARAAHARPSKAGTDQPGEVGYLLGSAHGTRLWCSVEDSALLVGPPRMGKGLHVVIPWILDAPGPVVATSTRPDSLAVALQHRAGRGPVAVFDPQNLSGTGGGLRWSPVRGCQHPRLALVRARGLATAAGHTGTTDSDFWTGQTETALRCLLHAAALAGHGPLDLYLWSLDPVKAKDAITSLAKNHRAAKGWSDALAAIIKTDHRTRDSVWLGVRQALASLADPAVLTAVDPEPGQEFDPEAFLKASGTLFLLSTAVGSGSCAPLVSAFVEDITETARTLAARSPRARLDPPLLLALDEIANLTPLPSLPSLMAEGGGSGITTLAVFQSLAQVRHRWGEHAADAIWDAATVKIVLGGLAKTRDLEDVSRLLGDIDEPTSTESRGRDGEKSTSVSLRQVPVMPPAVLRTLPFGTAVLLLRHTRPAVIDLAPWTSRADHARLVRDRTQVEDAARENKPLPGLPPSAVPTDDQQETP